MLTASDIAQRARPAPPLVVSTAYDYSFARALEASGAVDVLLVGDSLANVVLGLPSTRDVGMAEMLLFTGAVARGAPGTHVTADLPYGADATPDEAVRNGLLLRAAGAASVKLEGCKPEIIRALTAAGVPVMGHLGLLPQTATSFRKVGASEDDRARLLREVVEIEAAGAFAFVIENTEDETARRVTEAVSIPSIGIGAGAGTRGQVQVLYDWLGLGEKAPPFAKSFAGLRADVAAAARAYAAWVRGG